MMPFSALGLDTYAVGETQEQILETAAAVFDGKYALVVVAENIALTVQPVFAVRQSEPTPCVVVVPFTTESSGFATQALGEVLKLATGINILQNN